MSAGTIAAAPVDVREGAPRLAEWRRGWPAVAASSLGYGTGGAMILLSAQLFILPMRTALGWSTRAVAIAPIVSILIALGSPLGGAVVDRIGSRRAAILGTILLAASTGALAVVPVGPVTLYGLAALIGLVSTLALVPTYTRAVATWFRAGPGLAFGVTLSGSALVAIVALPAVNAAIQAHGWRAGYLAVAAIMLFVGLPAVLLGCREKPRVRAATAAGPADAPLPGITMREALHSARFWLYLAALCVGCLGTGGFVAHLQPILVGQGFAVREAVGITVAFAIAMSVGKIVGGLLLDRLWPFGIAAGLMVLAAAGAFGIVHAAGPAAGPFAVAMACLIGLGQGAESDFVAFFGLRAFGLRAYSSIMGVYAMVVTIALSAIGYGFGWIVDAYGSYRPACHLGGTCLLAAAAMFLLIGLGEHRTGRRRPAATVMAPAAVP